jgi:hypothetical protein
MMNSSPSLCSNRRSVVTVGLRFSTVMSRDAPTALSIVA